MFELDGDFPFLWRLGAESTEGFCAVSMIVPYQVEDDRQDLTIETSVLSMSSDRIRSEHGEVLEWNQDDINLFLKMVNHQRQNNNLLVSDTVRIDLTDPSIIEIINVVAAAGFGTAYTSFGVLHNSRDRYCAYHCHIGGFASLNTVNGFKTCVVVAIEDDDVVCVLLEDVQTTEAVEFDQLSRHDLLLVKKADVLHPEFSKADLNSDSKPAH